jgi:hypothetical protein
MNCENCKYPTLCKAVVIGSVVSVITAAWCYYRSSSKPKNEDQKPKNEEPETTQPDVNM